MLIEVFEQCQACCGAFAELLNHFASVALAQVDDPLCGGGGFGADVVDALQEEAEPAFPVTVQADVLQALIVLLAVKLEVVREVQERPLECFLPAEHERHE